MDVGSQQLAPFRRLFEELLQRRVGFALFKGLDKVDSVLGGAEGDIDILLQPEVRNEVDAAFASAGFHQDRGAIDRLGQTVAVYRAFDAQSAQFVTVHAYEQLLLGDWFEFRYPDERKMLSASLERNGYRIVAPDHEWVIRACNDLAKRRFDDPYLVELGARVGANSAVINDGLQRFAHIAFADLLSMFERCDADALGRLRRTIFAPEPAVASALSARASQLVRKARAGWQGIPLSRVRNKVGTNRSISIQSPDEALAKEVATQVAAQLAPVARVKLVSVGGGLGRLKVAMQLWRGKWVVLLGGSPESPVDLQVRLVEQPEGVDAQTGLWLIDVREHGPEAIASMIIDQGLRHSLAR